MIRKIALAVASASLLTACGGGGDININPSTTDNSTNNSNNTTTSTGGGDENPCAFYVTDGGQTVQGTFDATSGNCTYSSAFVSAGNELENDLNIPALADGGAHIFQGDLIVGTSFDSDAALAAAGIAQGGDGPTLTIEPGVTMGWPQGRSLIVNRGSQIIASGTAVAPITLTSTTDINGDLNVAGADGAEAVEQWGGMLINGFGYTNECDYDTTTGSRADNTMPLASECHVVSEGITGAAENRHGGQNDDDNSGRLEFVLVKHTGGDLGAGNDLNGITFGSVGRSTVLNNVETYSTLDDGIEFFGGAANITNYAGIYNRDDSIDLDAGWIGDLTNGLVIHSETQGNHCIESDGIDDHDDRLAGDATIYATLRDAGLVTAPTITNLTCIVSPSAEASQDPGAGWRLREGINPTIIDSLLIGSHIAPAAADPTDNYGVRIEDGTRDDLATAFVTLDGVIVAFADTVASVDQALVEAEGVLFASVPAGAALDPTAAADTALQVLEGTPPIFSIPLATATVDDTSPPAVADAVGDFVGVLQTTDTNVFAGWTFGIFDGSRTQPFFFE